MGAHSRPRRGLFDDSPGRHRGDLAPYVDADLTAAAGKAAAGLATAGVAGAAVVTGAGAALAAPTAPSAAQVYAAPSPDQLAALRGCESSGNYAINTGNGFYGAYQFDLQTWQGLGYSGRPDQAAPATQDQAATTLEESRGWEPWPACSKKLGLTAIPAGTTTNRGQLASRTLNRVTGTTSSVATESHAVVVSAPAFQGTQITTALESQKRADVMVWQSRMARRGWPITVDGYFGKQSANIAWQFAVEKKIPNTKAGSINAAVWQAAWTSPIT